MADASFILHRWRLIHSLTHLSVHFTGFYCALKCVGPVLGTAVVKVNKTQVPPSGSALPLSESLARERREEGMLGNEGFTEVLPIASGLDDQLRLAGQRERTWGEGHRVSGGEELACLENGRSLTRLKTSLSLWGQAELCGPSGQGATEWGTMAIRLRVGSSRCTVWRSAATGEACACAAAGRLAAESSLSALGSVSAIRQQRQCI